MNLIPLNLSKKSLTLFKNCSVSLFNMLLKMYNRGEGWHIQIIRSENSKRYVTDEKKNLGGGGGIGGLYKSYKCIKVFCPPLDCSASDENISALPIPPQK